MHDRYLGNIPQKLTDIQSGLLDKFQQIKEAEKIKNNRLMEDKELSTEESNFTQNWQIEKKQIANKIAEIISSISISVSQAAPSILLLLKEEDLWNFARKNTQRVGLAKDMSEKMEVILNVASYSTIEEIEKLNLNDFKIIRSNLAKLINARAKDEESSKSLHGIRYLFSSLNLLEKISEIKNQNGMLKEIEKKKNVKIENIRIKKQNHQKRREAEDRERLVTGTGVAMQAANEKIKTGIAFFLTNITENFNSLSDKKDTIMTGLQQHNVCLRLGKERYAMICNILDYNIVSLKEKKDELVRELNKLNDSFTEDKNINQQINAFNILFSSFDEECVKVGEILHELMPELLIVKYDIQVARREYEILSKNLIQYLKDERTFSGNLDDLKRNVDIVSKKIKDLLLHCNDLENMIGISQFNGIKKSIMSLKNDFEVIILPEMIDCIFLKIEDVILLGRIDDENINQFFGYLDHEITQLNPNDQKIPQLNEKLIIYKELYSFLVYVQSNFSFSYLDIIEKHIREIFASKDVSKRVKELIILLVEKKILPRLNSQFDEIEKKCNVVGEECCAEQVGVLFKNVENIEKKLKNSIFFNCHEIKDILDKLNLFSFRGQFLDLSIQFNQLKKSNNLSLFLYFSRKIDQFIEKLRVNALPALVTILNNCYAIKNEAGQFLENSIEEQVNQLEELIETFGESSDCDDALYSILGNIDDFIKYVTSDEGIPNTIKSHLNKYQHFKNKIEFFLQIERIQKCLLQQNDLVGSFVGGLAFLKCQSHSSQGEVIIEELEDLMKKPNIIKLFEKCPKANNLKELITAHQKIKAIAICNQEIARLRMDKGAHSKLNAFIALHHEINNSFDQLSYTVQDIIRRNQTRYVTANGQFSDEKGKGVYINHVGEAVTFTEIIERNRSGISNDKSRVTSFKTLNKMLAMSPPHVVVDTVLPEKNPHNCFTSLYLDYEVIKSPEEQARFILDFELKLYQLGYRQFHVCYSANDKQALTMEKTGDFSGFNTTVQGSNQAAMLAAKKKLLWEDKEYICLRGGDHILPITTCKQAITGKKEIDDKTLNNNLNRISTVLKSNDQSVVICLVSKGGLHDDLTIKTPAIGGGVFRLSDSQNKIIKDEIDKYESGYPSSPEVKNRKNELYRSQYKMDIEAKLANEKLDSFRQLLCDIDNKISEKSKQFNILSTSGDYKIEILQELKKQLKDKKNSEKTVEQVIDNWKKSKSNYLSKNSQKIKQWKGYEIIVTEKELAKENMLPNLIAIQKNNNNEFIACWIEGGTVVSKTIEKPTRALIERLTGVKQDCKLDNKVDQRFIDEIKFKHHCGAPHATCEELIHAPRSFLFSSAELKQTDSVKFVNRLCCDYGNLLCGLLVEEEKPKQGQQPSMSQRNQ